MDQSPERSACAACAEFADDLAALATGALTGRRRAAAVIHVERCSGCEAELESLSASADALLELYPEVEPDEGFTERVMTRIGDEQVVVRRRPRVRGLVAAAAAVAALGLGGGLAAAYVPQGGNPASHAVTATLQSPSGQRGSVMLTSTDGNWLFMMFDGDGIRGTVSCDVVLTNGSRKTVGRFLVKDGYGSWTVRLPVPTSSIREVVVVSGSGETLAVANVRQPRDVNQGSAHRPPGAIDR